MRKIIVILIFCYKNNNNILVPNVLLLNAYNDILYYDLLRKVTLRFVENTYFRATFSTTPQNIISILKQPKTNKFKLITLDIRSIKDRIISSLDMAGFPEFDNFYPCNIYQSESNLILIAGVDREPGKKEIDLKCPHSLYLVRGDLISNNFAVKKMKLFSSQGYSDMFLESTLISPTYKFLYLENRYFSYFIC